MTYNCQYIQYIYGTIHTINTIHLDVRVRHLIPIYPYPNKDRHKSKSTEWERKRGGERERQKKWFWIVDNRRHSTPLQFSTSIDKLVNALYARIIRVCHIYVYKSFNILQISKCSNIFIRFEMKLKTSFHLQSYLTPPSIQCRVWYRISYMRFTNAHHIVLAVLLYSVSFGC